MLPSTLIHCECSKIDDEVIDTVSSVFVTKLPMTVTTRHARTLAVPRSRQLLAGLSLRRLAFDPGPVHVGFVVDEVALGQVPSPSTSVFACQYRSTSAPHSFTSQSPTPYNLVS